MTNMGILGCVVWPPYCGLSQGEPGLGPIAENEPFGDINYARGMISWHTENSDIFGSARIYVPKGIYTHVVFFSGPHLEAFMAANKFEQPIVFNRPGVVDIDPIHCDEYLPRF